MRICSKNLNYIILISCLKRKKARTGNDPELDKAVYSWFVKARWAGTPINGPVMSVQAVQLCNLQEWHKTRLIHGLLNFAALPNSDHYDDWN